MRITFEIPGTLPTMNEIIAKSKQHYGAYSKMKKNSTQLVINSAKGLPAIESADFHIVWYCKDMRKDKDNIIAGQKFIFDGLVDGEAYSEASNCGSQWTTSRERNAGEV